MLSSSICASVSPRFIPLRRHVLHSLSRNTPINIFPCKRNGGGETDHTISLSFPLPHVTTPPRPIPPPPPLPCRNLVHSRYRNVKHFPFTLQSKEEKKKKKRTRQLFPLRTSLLSPLASPPPPSPLSNSLTCNPTHTPAGRTLRSLQE